MEGRIATNSADAPGLAYLTTPAMAAALKTTDVGTDTGQFVWSAGPTPGEGRVNGFAARYSANVPAGHIVLGDWSQFLVGTWFTLELMEDPYGTNFAKGSVSVRALMDVDFAVRHAEAFETLNEAAS